MSVTMDKAFLGVGWSFPVTTEPNGNATLALFEEDIRQAVLLILETAAGERVMRPDFGAGLHRLVFEPLNTTTIALARHTVERALILWEPRIDSVQVSVTAGGASSNRLDIEIRYRIRATNTFYNLVYPFYLREGRPTPADLGTGAGTVQRA
jgi:phage baseplate assembly protein W